MGKPFYITTTLPYVNADPHIGFALEVVQADVLARARRILDDEVFFNTGTDEHGQKIFEAAGKVGEDVRVYTDRYADEVKKLKDALNLSYTNFIRTTDSAHERAAQELWKRCKKKGDIEKKSYVGLYCIGCEEFKTQKDIGAGSRCKLHPTLAIQTIQEENWFFKLSNYQDRLREYLSQKDVIIPEFHRKEALAFVESGLEDFSVSREVSRMNWGIPVPDDKTQVMYVWFDALTNYISTLGWPDDRDGNFKKFWEGGETLQMAGKDQVRFQSIMWQAMLMSAGVKNTDRIFYHGFITSGGQRMSKSLGNVMSPFDLVERYGTDATRYLLLRHAHPTGDTDVTWERLDEWYEAHLVNGLGNLVARILKMSSQYLDNTVDISHIREMPDAQVSLEKYEFNHALDSLWSAAAVLDSLIQEQKPFEVFKADRATAQKQVSYLVQELARIAKHLEPFMPETSRKIEGAILANTKPENLFPRLPA